MIKNAVCKKCRRAGIKLFLKGEKCFSPKCPMVRRKYPPGVHGPKGKRRLSEYGLELQEKQKAKAIYGIGEAQFKKYFKKASKKKGIGGQELIRLLESRLDNVVFRLGLAQSRSQARQLVNHGHIMVNDRKVNIPSYQVKKDDTIKVREQSKKSSYFKSLAKTLASIKPPSWLKLEAKNLAGKIIDVPTPKELEQSIDTNLIVEYYSR